MKQSGVQVLLDSKTSLTKRGANNLRILLFATTAITIINFSAVLKNADAQTVPTNDGTAVNAGEVSASISALDTLSKLPTKKSIFKSTQSVKVVGRKQLRVVGPAAGAAQALSVAPGVNIASDGTTGAPRASISINGMKTGWGNIAGNANDGTVMVTFDGVPMIDPAYGVWQASEIPNLSFIKGLSVTYGPGYPVNRWYDNIGGSINYAPIEPTAKPQAEIGGFFGSYGNRGTNFSVDTGKFNGWSAVFAGTIDRSGNYLRGYGFDNPQSSYAYYGKLVKTFSNGRISIGGFASRSVAFRPLPIPTTANPNVTINGVNSITGAINPGPIYSQQTTGFYTTLPRSIYFKQAPIRTYLLYSRLTNHVDSYTTFHNLLFFRYGNRIHLHYDNIGNSPSALNQDYNAASDTYGDKPYFTFSLPDNKLSVGGYFVYSKYNSFLDFYNPTLQATYNSLSPNAGQPALINGAPANYSLQLPNAFHSSYLYETDLAGFVQDDFQPTKALRITPGVRIVSFHTNFVNNSQAAFPTSVTDLIGHNGDYQPNSTTNFTEIEPSIGVNYKLTHDIALYGNYSTAYKAPAGATGTYAHLLSSTLKPQKSTQYQVGAKLFIPNEPYLHHAIVSINYYHLNDLNEIIPIPVVSHLYSLFASGSSVFHGVNLYAEDDPLYNLHVFANASFESANYLNYTSPSHGSYAGLPISNVPAETFNAGAYYTLFSHDTIYQPRIWYQYTGTQNIYNNNIGAPTRTKLPAYGVLNLGMKVSVATPHASYLRKLTFNVDLLNVANKQYNIYEYISSGGYYGVAGQTLAEPGAPFTAYASVNAHFR
ncbi:TonB-dependent receptor [Acidiphilium sp. AL]|uniref:TonB-dependent receptor n=1 Tax=Acidiphilium sp. AL TaxID=2871704 RepID=UPI0021CB2C8F|nr:TonB-dependent receptor [Acidiphilium sp. AL]MCU4161588.1 TonB-dependent receptor [Acidiphilium sp. AL]